MGAPRIVLLPVRANGKLPPNPTRWLCDRGHLHPSRLKAIRCNQKNRKENDR